MRKVAKPEGKRLKIKGREAEVEREGGTEGERVR